MGDNNHRFFRAHLVLEEMAIDRGYIITPERVSPSSMSGDEMNRTFITPGLPNMYIRYISKISKEDASAIVNEFGLSHVIVIIINDGTKNSITSQARDMLNKGYNAQIEIFSIPELQVNPSRHFFTPETKRLNAEEAKEFAKERGNLSKIKHTDILARYYYWRRGDIIRITEDDLTNVQMAMKSVRHSIVT